MKNVLILFAHPAIRKSLVNRTLVDAVRNLPGVLVNDLYEAYPDFFIDVPREQALLQAADVVIMQHPFYWYSVPALLKEWMDLVLEYGFAYGEGGTALRDRTLLTATSTGGSAGAYSHGEEGRATMRELLSPIQQTAQLCGMTYLPPFVVHDARGVAKSGELPRLASQYRNTVEALRDGTLTESDWSQVDYLNECR